MRKLLFLLLMGIPLLLSCRVTPTAVSPTPASSSAAVTPVATPTSAPVLTPSSVRSAITALVPQPQQPADIIWQICSGRITTQAGDYVYQLQYPNTWLMDYAPLTSNCGYLFSALNAEGDLPANGIELDITLFDCRTSPECAAPGQIVRGAQWSGLSYGFYDDLSRMTVYQVTIPVEEQAMRLTFMLNNLPEKTSPETLNLLGYMLYTLSIGPE